MKNTVKTEAVKTEAVKTEKFNLETAARRFIHLRHTRKALEEREEKLRAAILSHLPSIPYVIAFSEESGLAVKEVEFSNFDSARFKAEHPELWAEYQVKKSRVDMRETKL